MVLVAFDRQYHAVNVVEDIVGDRRVDPGFAASFEHFTLGGAQGFVADAAGALANIVDLLFAGQAGGGAFGVVEVLGAGFFRNPVLNAGYRVRG